MEFSMSKFRAVLIFITLGIAFAAPDLAGTVKATMSGDGYEGHEVNQEFTAEGYFQIT